jgi:hypothetical protein
MPHAKNKTEREWRRKVVADMRLAGKTLFQIAEALNVDRRTVHDYLKVMERQWLEEASCNFSEMRKQKHLDLLRISEQAWDSFYASCREDCPEGDPRFLIIAMNVEEKIIALYKLDDAERFWKNDIAGGDRSDAIDSQVVEVVVESREEVAATMSFRELVKYAKAHPEPTNGKPALPAPDNAE